MWIYLVVVERLTPYFFDGNQAIHNLVPPPRREFGSNGTIARHPIRSEQREPF